MSGSLPGDVDDEAEGELPGRPGSGERAAESTSVNELTSPAGAARRIAVDLNPLLPGGENGGAATATLNLIAQMAARGRELLLYVLPENAGLVDHLVGPNVERFVVRRASIPPQGERARAPWPPPWSLSRALGADVLFCPFGDPFWAEDGVPTVCTINDLQHLDLPEHFSETELAHRSDYLGRVVRFADAIVVPSNFTRRSVEAHLAPVAPIEVVGYPADRHWVGVDPVAAAYSPPPRARDRRFLLYPANAWPHKNHARLFEAMAIHRDRANLGADRPPVRLVCTGSTLQLRRELEVQVERLGLSGLVEIVGHVSDARLHRLYQQASGVIFPSTYEGFGLPVLEAMVQGVPVACSHTTALVEVAGDATFGFDPLDIAAIADAIDALAYDEALAAGLVRRGSERVKDYETESVVRRLLEVLDRSVQSFSAPKRPPSEPPTIGVVMPSYQQGAFIGRTIESVIAQGDIVSSFVVCDGGSTDGTVDVLESRRDVLDYVSEPDGGQAAAVNKGIAKTASDVIAWLNSDDIWYPDALRTVATVFAHHPDLRWVYFAADHIDTDDEVIEPYYDRPWDESAFRDMCFICQPACFFTTNFVRQVGGLDESLRYCMDYELWFRMGAVQPPVYVPVITSGSRLYPTNKTLGQRGAVLEETVDMLGRVHGRASQWWLLGQISEEVDSRRDWNPSNPSESRLRHRMAVAIALRTFVRHRSIPDHATRGVLLSWTKEAMGGASSDPTRPRGPAPSRLSRRVPRPLRGAVSRPYHSATRWVRRRTMYELEPRLTEIEKGVRASHRAIETIDRSVKEQDERLAQVRPTELQLERLAFQHHQVEEALVERLTAELIDLRVQVHELQRRLDERVAPAEPDDGGARDGGAGGG